MPVIILFGVVSSVRACGLSASCSVLLRASVRSRRGGCRAPLIRAAIDSGEGQADGRAPEKSAARPVVICSLDETNSSPLACRVSRAVWCLYQIRLLLLVVEHLPAHIVPDRCCSILGTGY
jgi:hypothetical protein